VTGLPALLALLLGIQHGLHLLLDEAGFQPSTLCCQLLFPLRFGNSCCLTPSLQQLEPQQQGLQQQELQQQKYLKLKASQGCMVVFHNTQAQLLCCTTVASDDSKPLLRQQLHSNLSKTTHPASACDHVQPSLVRLSLWSLALLTKNLSRKIVLHPKCHSAAAHLS
jgi:hypothetical protein